MRKIFSLLLSTSLITISGSTVVACGNNSKNFSKWTDSQKKKAIADYVNDTKEFLAKASEESPQKTFTWGDFIKPTKTGISDLALPPASYLGILAIIMKETGAQAKEEQKIAPFELTYKVSDASYGDSSKLTDVFKTGFTVNITATKNQLFSGNMDWEVKAII